MKRREAIAGAASLGILGTGGVIAARGMPSLGDAHGSSDGSSDPNDDGSSGSGGPFSGAGSTEPVQLDEPVTVETLDLPWSDGEPITVPIEGSVTVLEFWATTCKICERTLPNVTAAHERVGDDVQFFSITAEWVGRQVTADEIETWWAEHGGGEWPIGYDETVELPIRLDIPGTPSTAIIDADGVTRWAHQGAVPTEKLLEEIEAAGGTVVETDK